MYIRIFVNIIHVYIHARISIKYIFTNYSITLILTPKIHLLSIQQEVEVNHLRSQV